MCPVYDSGVSDHQSHTARHELNTSRLALVLAFYENSDIYRHWLARCRQMSMLHCLRAYECTACFYTILKTGPVPQYNLEEKAPSSGTTLNVSIMSN